MNEFTHKLKKTLDYHYKQAATGLRTYWWDSYHAKAERPIFVVGCSRAGTTLVYKTLSESREIGTLQRETHDFWVALHPLQRKNWKTHALSASDASDQDRDYVTRYFFSRTGKRRFVDKNNQNGLSIPYLHALFPDAGFVYVKRSPGDNLNSLIEGWSKPEEFATWSGQLPENISIDGGKYTKWCFFLSDGWKKYLNASIEDVCAFQYNAINQTILDAKNMIPTQQWYEVFYEDIVQDPLGQFRSLFGACDLGFDRQLARHCSDVLNIPYNAFSEIRLDKWKNGSNRNKIERVMGDVAQVAKAMGYTV